MRSSRLRSIGRPAGKNPGEGFARFLPALMMFLLVPAAAIFCWHWNGPIPSISHQPSSAGDFQILAPKAELRVQPAGFSGFRMPRLDLTHSSGALGMESPFRVAASRAKIAAQGDPFLEALVSGAPEGSLTLIGSEGGVPIFGPPLPDTRAIRFVDPGILQAIQASVGGSFQSFYSDTFGEPEGVDASSEEGEDARRENPFLEAMESLAKGQAAEAAAKPVEDTAKQELPEEPDAPPKSPDPQQPPLPLVASPVRSVNTDRPHWLLKIGARGDLEASPASQPREGALESEALGVREFDILPFDDPANGPTGIAAADYDGDGFPDVCIKLAPQETLRFFHGSADGSYQETKRVKVGRGERSIASGDFNGDGLMDLAVSSRGTGALVLLYATAEGSFAYKALWSETYRDYITVADVTGEKQPALVGIAFPNRATVLFDPLTPDGAAPQRQFVFEPSLDVEVSAGGGESVRLNALVLSANLSVNVGNWQGMLTNVLNVASGTDVHVVIGDLHSTGKLVVGIANLR